MALFHRLLCELAERAETAAECQLQAQLIAALYELLDADEDVKRVFASTVARPDCDIVSALLRLLQAVWERPDDTLRLPPHFLPRTLCYANTTLLLATMPTAFCDPGHPQHWAGDSACKSFVEWLLRHPLSSPPLDSNVPLLATTFQSLRELVRFPPLLRYFHERDGLLRVSPLLLPSVLAEPYHYNLACLLWISTFELEHCDDFLSLGLLPHLVAILSTALHSEKCVRVHLCLLQRLTRHETSGAVVEYLLEADLPGQLRSLSTRQWRDVDLVRLIVEMRQSLESVRCELSGSWSAYRSELLSASLHPSPPHRSRAFFQSHLELFAANNAAVVRRLLGLLADGRVGGVSRATAARDLGELAICGAAGKRLLLEEARGVKEALLRASSKDSEHDATVRRAAFEAVQKLLVPNWDEFEKQCKLEAVHLTVRPPIRLPEQPIASISLAAT